MEIDVNRKYGIDGQWILFKPILLQEGDMIDQDGTILMYMGDDYFRLFTDNPTQEFVPAIKLTKKWRIL